MAAKKSSDAGAGTATSGDDARGGDLAIGRAAPGRRTTKPTDDRPKPDNEPVSPVQPPTPVQPVTPAEPTEDGDERLRDPGNPFLNTTGEYVRD